jgi:hypothetical protein
MIDINKLAFLVTHVPMSDGERAAMLKMIPRLPVKHLRVLMRILDEQYVGANKVRLKYLARAQKLVDKSKVQSLRRNLKHGVV